MEDGFFLALVDDNDGPAKEQLEVLNLQQVLLDYKMAGVAHNWEENDKIVDLRLWGSLMR